MERMRLRNRHQSGKKLKQSKWLFTCTKMGACIRWDKFGNDGWEVKRIMLLAVVSCCPLLIQEFEADQSEKTERTSNVMEIRTCWDCRSTLVVLITSGAHPCLYRVLLLVNRWFYFLIHSSRECLHPSVSRLVSRFKAGESDSPILWRPLGDPIRFYGKLQSLIDFALHKSRIYGLLGAVSNPGIWTITES